MARKKEEKVELKVEPKKVKPVVVAKKVIPELVEELHALFTALHADSYRARQCSRLMNKIKRLVGADEVLKG